MRLYPRDLCVRISVIGWNVIGRRRAQLSVLGCAINSSQPPKPRLSSANTKISEMTLLSKLTIPAVILTIGAVIGAYYCTGFPQSLLLSTAEVLGGFALALILINGFLNQEERKKAAIVLMEMVHTDIVEYHNAFLREGRDKFGIPVWNGIIDAINENKRKPEALAPEQRTGVLEIIETNADKLSAVTKSFDERFREITYVLGWSFHPKITRDCMRTRLEIDKFRTLLDTARLDGEQELKQIELYFDIEADTSAVLNELARICRIQLT